MKRKMKFLFIISLLLTAFVLSNCATYVKSGGIKVMQSDFELSKSTVMTQHAYTFNCTQKKLQTTAKSSSSVYVQTIKVRGCGQQAVYVRTKPLGQEWVLYSHTPLAKGPPNH
mgnify:CR=1 FL=1